MSTQAERAALLGDAVNGHPELVATVLPQLERILCAPEDATALVTAIEATGNAWDPRAAERLLDLVDPAHPDGQVRLALAQALPGGSLEEPVRGRAIRALIALTRDELSDVRNWACFGLSQLDADCPPARDALIERLDDKHLDTRHEALFALAKLSDPRARAACAHELDSDVITLLVLRSAAELSDPDLLPQLNRISERWEGDEDAHTEALALAVEACSNAIRDL